MPHAFPAESVIKINLPVLFFCVGLALATSIIFGLSPALQLSRPDVAKLMQGSGRRVAGSTNAKRAHNALVATQVALTILMLSGASAAAKGFLHLVHAHLGYDPHFAMSVPIPVHENTHGAWKDRAEYFDQLRVRMAGMPEVVSAGISTNATPPSNGRTQQFEIFGSASGEKPEALVNYISGEYFPVLRIPLVQGRIWDHAETMRGAPVAMINQTMARQFWPSSNPVGQQLRIPALRTEPYSPAAPGIEGAWLQIVGVVADVLDDGLRKPIKPAIYVPYTLQMYMFTQILIRTRIPPASMLRDIRAQVVQVDPDQQVTHAQDLETWIVNEDEYGQQRFVATLFAIFSILALVLAAVGLYSVVSYGVATRTNEFGIRMALGAKAADVFRLVLSSTAMSLSIGLATGLILSIAFDKLATKWVNESSHDPANPGRRNPHPNHRRSVRLLRPSPPRRLGRPHGRPPLRVTRPLAVHPSAALFHVLFPCRGALPEVSAALCTFGSQRGGLAADCRCCR